MNTLTQIGNQLRELFESMTPSSRVLAGLMAGVIVVSIGWLLASQQDRKAYILGVMSPEEIRRAEEAFGTASLGDYEIVNGTRIQVPLDQKAAYMNALSSGNAIPAQWGDIVEDSLQPGVFDPPSLTSKRLTVARAREFGQTLRRLPEVHWAAVTCDEQKGGFGKEPIKVCSIQVESFGKRPIDMSVLQKIAESATTYFAGLRKENVSVLDVGSANIYRASDDPLGAGENKVLMAQAGWENHYHQKVSDMLSHYGAVKLGVSVELDPKLLEESEKLSYDPTGVAVYSQNNRTDSESAKATAGGRPGSASNEVVSTGNGPASLSSNSPAQTSKIKESGESTRSQFGTEAVVTKMAGLVPKEVKISVGIPKSYFNKVHQRDWELLNPTQTIDDYQDPLPDELKAIEDQVLKEVEDTIAVIPSGLQPGVDRTPFTRVYSYTDLPTPPMPEASMTETAMAWLGESWSTIAMLAIVLVSLGMMFSWVKGSPSDPETEQQFAEGFGLKIPEQIDELDLTEEEGDEVGEDGERIPPTFEVTGGEMKDDLSALIKDNPEAAVNLLKTWIGDAA